MSNLIHVNAFDSVDIAPDGKAVRFNGRNERGEEGTLELPAPLVNQLMMTLPRVIEQALRNSHDDQTVRLVHPLEYFRIELGEPDDKGVPRYILSLRTDGEFEVSFTMTGNQLGTFVQEVVDQVLCDGGELESVALNS